MSDNFGTRQIVQKADTLLAANVKSNNLTAIDAGNILATIENEVGAFYERQLSRYGSPTVSQIEDELKVWLQNLFKQIEDQGGRDRSYNNDNRYQDPRDRSYSNDNRYQDPRDRSYSNDNRYQDNRDRSYSNDNRYQDPRDRGFNNDNRYQNNRDRGYNNDNRYQDPRSFDNRQRNDSYSNNSYYNRNGGDGCRDSRYSNDRGFGNDRGFDNGSGGFRREQPIDRAPRTISSYREDDDPQPRHSKYDCGATRNDNGYVSVAEQNIRNARSVEATRKAQAEIKATNFKNKSNSRDFTEYPERETRNRDGKMDNLFNTEPIPKIFNWVIEPLEEWENAHTSISQKKVKTDLSDFKIKVSKIKRPSFESEIVEKLDDCSDNQNRATEKSLEIVEFPELMVKKVPVEEFKTLIDKTKKHLIGCKPEEMGNVLEAILDGEKKKTAAIFEEMLVSSVNSYILGSGLFGELDTEDGFIGITEISAIKELFLCDAPKLARFKNNADYTKMTRNIVSIGVETFITDHSTILDFENMRDRKIIIEALRNKYTPNGQFRVGDYWSYIVESNTTNNNNKEARDAIEALAVTFTVFTVKANRIYLTNIDVPEGDLGSTKPDEVSEVFTRLLSEAGKFIDLEKANNKLFTIRDSKDVNNGFKLNLYTTRDTNIIKKQFAALASNGHVLLT